MIKTRSDGNVFKVRVIIELPMFLLQILFRYNFFPFLKFARGGEHTRDLFCYFHLFLSHLMAELQLLTPVQFTFGSSQNPEFPIIKYLPFFSSHPWSQSIGRSWFEKL